LLKLTKLILFHFTRYVIKLFQWLQYFHFISHSIPCSNKTPGSEIFKNNLILIWNLGFTDWHAACWRRTDRHHAVWVEEFAKLM